MADETAIADTAYAASIRALSSQEAQLTGLHTRASFLLGTAGIATGTVLGTNTTGVHGWPAAAVGAFALAPICATWILAPRRDAWRFTLDASVILNAKRDHTDLTAEQISDWLARRNQGHLITGGTGVIGRACRNLPGTLTLLSLAVGDKRQYGALRSETLGAGEGRPNPFRGGLSRGSRFGLVDAAGELESFTLVGTRLDVVAVDTDGRRTEEARALRILGR